MTKRILPVTTSRFPSGGEVPAGRGSLHVQSSIARTDLWWNGSLVDVTGALGLGADRRIAQSLLDAR
jgi:hypothetical protein